jgi:hypothetical protein
MEVSKLFLHVNGAVKKQEATEFKLKEFMNIYDYE